MGRVSGTGYAKIFEGSATDPDGVNIPDSNSIQAAIKGTLDNPTTAIKNMDTLASLSKLDMFVPKRTTLPIDTAAYRQFPTPTILFNFNGFLDDDETQVWVDGELNNKVGWHVSFQLEIFLNNTLQQDSFIYTVTIPAGTTTFINRYTIPFGSSTSIQAVTCAFFGIPAIYIEDELKFAHNVDYQIQKYNNTNNNGRVYGNFTLFETTTITTSTDGSVNIISDQEKFLLQSTVASQTLSVDLNGGNYTAEYYIRTKQTNNTWIYQNQYTTPITANFALYDYKIIVDS